MTHILLLDLDDTLIDNSMDTFLPAYTRGLSQALLRYAQPPLLLKSLMAGIQAMVENQRPDRTLEDEFDSVFYPSLGIQKEEARLDIDEFYRDIFPSYHSLTRARPEAYRLIEEAQARGYRLVLATNPLFPRSAILQRVTWAGLPADPFPFELVPSFEAFHFSKPHPAYYAELLANIGWPDGPVIMIGDSPTEDILPARQAGFSTFQVEASGNAVSKDSGEANVHGSLTDVLPWIDKTPSGSLWPDFKTPPALTAVLRSTAALLDTLERSLPAQTWYERPEPDEWCLAEITCHMRDVDLEVNLPRIKKILDEENPFIPGQDTDPWADERDYIAQSCFPAIQAFIDARRQLLALLDNLDSPAWKRPARHAIFGPTNLLEMVNIIGGHDRMHAHQIHTVLGSVSPTEDRQV